MTSEQIRQRYLEINEKATDEGAFLSIDTSSLYEHRLNCLWYGGEIGKIDFLNGFTIFIDVEGDVRADLYRDVEEIASVIDKNNQGKFYKEMSPYIKDDEMLVKLQNLDKDDSGLELDLQDNNWIQFTVWHENKLDWSEEVILDKSDNVLDAFDNFPLFLEAINSLRKAVESNN